MTELIPIVLPLDQQEGTLAAIGTWLVGVGERVTQDQPLLEISTDKVSFEIAAPEAGLMAEILKIDGDEIAPGEILGRLRPETGGSVAAQPQPTPPPSASDPNPAVPDQPADQSAATRFSPAVRRALQKHQLDATLIRGSGRGGRITFQDVRGFLKERQPAAAQPALDLPPSGSTRRVPHTPMRLSIARHMVESALQKAPHVTTVFEVNFNAVLTHSRNTREGFSKQGIRLTLTSYLIAAAAHALQAVPEVNSRWHEDALEIFSDCNVGLATALGSGGLVVPVIRQAQNLDLFGIAAQLQELTERARKGRLSSADMEGGTFTITNHGVSGSLIATPIINQPQTAILGAGKIEKRIRVRDTSEGDSMQIQPMAYVTLSIDHRALDGFTANQFLSSFCARLEGWADPS